MPELTEQETMVLIAALKAAVTSYCRDAWMVCGPHGSNPSPEGNAMFLRLADEVIALGRKFGDPMD